MVIDSGDDKKGEDEVIIVSSDAEDEILIPALQEYVPELALLRVTRENLINAQKNSEEIKSLYEQAASQVQVTNQVYSLEKELLVKNRKDKLGNVVKLIVVSEELRDPIKSLCHEGTSAHLGITKSKDKLNRYFYWQNCYRDMEQFVKTCDQCQRAGKPNDKKKAPLKLVPVIQKGFTKLNIDACGPLPITSKGNRYLITAICMSSKFPEAIPVSDISSRYELYLTKVQGCHHTPSELVYGKNLRTPETLVMEHWMEPEEEGDLVTEYMFKLINRLKRCQEVAINKMEEMQVKRKTWYDKNEVKHEFKDGDLVLVLATSRANKLAVQWIGPGTILNKISETNYLVEIPGRRETSQIYHINMLKQYYKRPEHVNGLAGYYQKYINLFSVIAAPLTDALKGRTKKGEITWTTECENAFRELKGKLIDKPVLYASNFEREFIVQTDASNAGMGAVLTQLTEQGEEHPILYLTMTDHNPLVWLNRNVSSNPRLMRWALALQSYNFRIVHRSGKSHKNADSLSRSVIDN
ncbi:retrovirus-related Pol polyprotein from transposon 297 [Trichonephila clavipes]|nr:retrovirus-related Pol polyprotein from transposon 297 [Trichonephila clavipes]